MKNYGKAAAIVTFLTVAALATPAVGQDTEETTNVSVTVDSTTRVDLSPENLDYTDNSGVNPGNFDDTSDSGYNGVEIENSGSSNITNIYFNTSHPGSVEPNSTARPFGTGGPSNYDAGNFIQLNPVQELGGGVAGSDGYQYSSRLEFNESNELSYVQADTLGDGNTRYGRYRAANESFFWVISDVDGSSTTNGNNCDGNGASNLYVGFNAHSETQTGTVDFDGGSAGTDYHEIDISPSSNSDYGRVNETEFKAYEGDKNYTAFTYCGTSAESGSDSTHVYFNKWEVEDPEGDGQNPATTNSALSYILNAASAENDNALQPGEHFTVKTRVSVPYGVATGSVEEGNLEVIVS